jgi:hypothetical protein
VPLAHAAFPPLLPLLPLVGLLALAAVLAAVLVLLRRRRADPVQDLEDLPAADTPASAAPAASAAAEEAGAAPAAPTSYADLARSLAEVGDLEAAVVCQWAADLRVLAPHLAGTGPELAGLIGAAGPDGPAGGGDPVALLRRAREAALSLVGTTSQVRALLTPIEHLTALVPDEGRPRGRHVGQAPTPPGCLPPELWALLPEPQRAAYDADGRQDRSA